MTLYGYSLLDVKTGVYSPAFFLNHDALAMRAVFELGQDKNTTPGKYPDDYVLYKVGVFDDNTGTLGSITPSVMGSVSAILGSFSNGSAVYQGGL